MKVRLDKAIVSLTRALDFVGVDEVHHSQRVALMAHAVAEALGWDESRQRSILYGAMLHDCGVSRVKEHRQLTETLEWVGAERHCLRGENYLLDCKPLAEFAPPVRWHHCRWEALDRQALGPQLSLETNLIFLADRLDVLLAPYIRDGGLISEILWDQKSFIERLRGLSGSMFAPELVEALSTVARGEGFWLQCDPCYVIEELEARLALLPVETLDGEQALAIARLFARTVDSKSRYTLDHSTRVAELARFLGERSGLEGDHLDMLEIAALLHDIGKLRVPEVIIDKPGPITAHERSIVKRHSYDTGRILSRVFPGLPIADWAAMHHENLLGSGYPAGIDGGGLPFEARLIAVADIFQALSQERPYRRRLDAVDVLSHMQGLVSDGRIDAELTELVSSHLERCYELAIGEANALSLASETRH